MNTRILLSALLSLAAVTGCDNFLSVKPQSQLTQEAFPTTAADALLATNAAYTTIRSWHYNTGGFPILDIMSDDTHKGSNPNDALNTVGPYDTFTHGTTQDGLDRWWASLYQGVRRANVVIEKVPAIDMNPALRSRYIAEAKFLRAVYYFDLVRGFGGVPLVTNTTPPLKMPRATANEVFAQVESDLIAAVADLPEKSAYGAADLGRASKGAAKAMLARMYLFRGDFVNAERYALEVIASNLYDLEPVFVDANSRNGEHGVESIFEVGALESESAFGNQYANTQGVRGTPNRGWGFNRPSVDLRAAFESGDPRFKGTIIDLGDVLDGVTIMGDGETPDVLLDGSGNILQIESYNRKVWIPGTTTTTQFGHNRRLIRYADVLLMAAEALNENNKPADALVHLNRVRARARQGNNAILPDVTTTDKSALRNAIYHERRVELALEGHRFWDLVRTGRAPAVLGSRGFITGQHELLPIPQNEIDISQGTLIQNPNW